MTNAQRDLYVFFMQAGISLAVLFFCFFNLSFPQKGNKGNNTFYTGCILLVIGYWLPSPATGTKQSNVAVDSQQTTIMANKEEP